MKALDQIRRYFRPSNTEPPRPNLGEEVRRLLNHREFEEKFDAASPFLMGSLIAWPVYWIYKGLDWHMHARRELLQLYIRKTFYKAKVMQFAILTTGLVFALAHDPSHTVMDYAAEDQ